MRLGVLGSSGTYPAAGRPCSGFLVQHGDTSVVADLGPGTFERLVDTLDLKLLDGVIITHRHADHCADVLALLHALAYGPSPSTGIPFLAPSSVIDALTGFLSAGPGHVVHRVFDFDPVEGGDVRRLGRLEVRFVDMDHSVPTVGIRCESDGKVLSYTGDTGVEVDWASLARDANLLVSEATHQGERQSVDNQHHLTAAEAGDIARQARAGRLMISHIPPHLDVLRSVEEAESTFGRSVELAVSGMTSEV